MIFSEIPFATPEYDQSVDLRFRVLRVPLGIEFKSKDLASEWNSIHLGAFTDELELIGCLVLVPLDDTTLKMRQVAVEPKLQGAGIGSELVKASERLSIDKGFTRLVLNARETAVPFYLRLDYKKVGKRFTEVSIPHFRMEKDLGTPVIED